MSESRCRGISTIIAVYNGVSEDVDETVYDANISRLRSNEEKKEVIYSLLTFNAIFCLNHLLDY